jgi:glycosyltransferase involved in cell wall biosynthesis
MQQPANYGVTSLSLVVEFENATTVSWDEVHETLTSLKSEVEALKRRSPRFSVEVVFAHPGPDAHSASIENGIAHSVESLFHLARVRVLSVEGGRYYELKNAGIEASTADVVILADSDAVFEPGWLESILSKFAVPETVAVNGYTYLRQSDFVSRTMAMLWVFPAREKDPKWSKKRSLNANNCAFRREWIQAFPFPIENGFKVGCTLLTHRLKQQGHSVVDADARAAHQPLRGWRFLFWRAMVTGRDADRKFCLLKSQSYMRRLAHAGSFLYKMLRRTVHRTLTLRKQIALPVWQLPAALILGIAFYIVSFFGQCLRIAGLAADVPEHIPPYAEYT